METPDTLEINKELLPYTCDMLLAGGAVHAESELQRDRRPVHVGPVQGRRADLRRGNLSFMV